MVRRWRILLLNILALLTSGLLNLRPYAKDLFAEALPSLHFFANFWGVIGEGILEV